MKAVPPHYLGTLKVLEDKHLQKNSTEFDKADSLRAAVFQVDFKNTKKKKKKAYEGLVRGFSSAYFR